MYGAQQAVLESVAMPEALQENCAACSPNYCIEPREPILEHVFSSKSMGVPGRCGPCFSFIPVLSQLGTLYPKSLSTQERNRIRLLPACYSALLVLGAR